MAGIITWNSLKISVCRSSSRAFASVAYRVHMWEWSRCNTSNWICPCHVQMPCKLLPDLLSNPNPTPHWISGSSKMGCINWTVKETTFHDGSTENNNYILYIWFSIIAEPYIYFTNGENNKLISFLPQLWVSKQALNCSMNSKGQFLMTWYITVSVRLLHKLSVVPITVVISLSYDFIFLFIFVVIIFPHPHLAESC